MNKTIAEPIRILQTLNTIELRREYAKQLYKWECYDLVQFHRKLIEELSVHDIICIDIIQNRDQFDKGDYCGVLRYAVTWYNRKTLELISSL